MIAPGTAEARKRAKEAAAKARALARKLEAAAGIKEESERERQQAKQRATASAGANVEVSALTDEDRRIREDREADDELWLRSYWPAFSWDEYYPLSPQQLQMVADFHAALTNGGDRAVAASRGEGKTTLACAMVLKSILMGQVKFAILFAANSKNASQVLAKIKSPLANSLEFRRFYPEVCDPVVALDNRVQRAKTQTVTGHRHDNGEPYTFAPTCFHWTGEQLIFPAVPGSPSAGAIVIAQGLDSAVRGMNVDNRRPDIVLIDDPDTADTTNNPDQAAKLLTNIDRGIAALGSQRRPVTRIALVTIASHCSAAAQLTDRSKYPSWRGRRDRFLLTPPTAADKWQEFVAACKEGWTREQAAESQPPIPREAHDFYLANREAMDAGAVVSNPNRYDHRQRPEGGTVEASALEHYYGWVARVGQANTSTELDNDPPTEVDGAQVLTPHRVLENRSGCEQRMVPAGTRLLTVGADVKKVRLHWVAIAWSEHLVGSIVDLGEWDLHTEGKKPGVCENLVLEGLQSFWDWVNRGPWKSEDGEPVQPDRFGIDSGWKEREWSSQPVHVFCSWAGRNCYATKGSANYRMPKPGPGIKVYDNCYLNTKDRYPLVLVNADHFKLKVQEAFTVDFGSPGSLGIHNPETDASGRDSYAPWQKRFAAHICSERWDPVRNRFPKNPPENHFLDATAIARVMAVMGGLSTIEMPARIKPRRTLAEMAAAARR
jgi:hypothetical protein